jgi:hypothetical protein
VLRMARKLNTSNGYQLKYNNEGIQFSKYMQNHVEVAKSRFCRIILKSKILNAERTYIVTSDISYLLA